MASDRTATPGSQAISRSTIAYLGLIGLLVGVRTLFTVAPPAVPLASQSAALSWPALGGLALVGAGGLAGARRTAIGDATVPTAPARRLGGVGWSGVGGRYLEAALVGLAAAAAFVAIDRVVPLGTPHVGWPLSVPFYLYGAVATEILFRLAPLGAAAWLGARIRPDRRWQAFAVAAALTAFVEPVGLLGTMAPQSGAVMALVFVVAYALNLAAAYLFWRYGILAAVIERAAFYLVWHVGYGGFV